MRRWSPHSRTEMVIHLSAVHIPVLLHLVRLVVMLWQLPPWIFEETGGVVDEIRQSVNQVLAALSITELRHGYRF